MIKAVGLIYILSLVTISLALLPLHFKHFEKGSTIRISCAALHSDDGQNTVQWLRKVRGSNSSEVLTSGYERRTDDERVSVIYESVFSIGSHHWTLTISPCEIEDTGIYSCQIIGQAEQFTVSTIAVRVVDSNYKPVSTDFTDCCKKQGVSDQCLFYCHLDAMNANETSEPEMSICLKHMPAVIKCITDRRNHVPCCEDQNVPAICREVCKGNYPDLTSFEHHTCSAHAEVTLSCISTGLKILPGPPVDVNVKSLSSTQLKVTWKPPNQTPHVNYYTINITELRKFNDPEEDVYYDDEIPAGDNNKKEIIHSVNWDITEYTISDLIPATIYEVTVTSSNTHGSSLPSYIVRAVTPYDFDHSPKLKNKELPDIVGCCKRGGIETEDCLDVFCDPSSVDQIRLDNVIRCASMANITFKCLTDGYDHSPCCQMRGVPRICLDFCRGIISQVDYRHFVCLNYMDEYKSCLMDYYDVLPEQPENLHLVDFEEDWVLLKWDPPTNLSNPVKSYSLFYQNKNEESEYIITNNVMSPQILEGLLPGTSYEAYIVAENKYGKSSPSNKILFSTHLAHELEEPVPNNINSCCSAAGINSTCMNLCSHQVTIDQMQLLGPICADVLSIIFRCAAEGHNHTSCCKQKMVDPVCLPLCAATFIDDPKQLAGRCGLFVNSIIECIAEDSKDIPSMPEDFQVINTTFQSATIQWNPPQTGSATTYRVHYTKVRDDEIIHPTNYTNIVNVTSTKTVLNNLEPDTKYSVYVIAMNKFGASLPSPLIMFKTYIMETDSEFINASRIIPGIRSSPHAVHSPSQTVDSITVSWKPPYDVPPHSHIIYMVHYLPTNNKSDLTENGKIIFTMSNSVILKGLSASEEYSIGIIARTDKGDSRISEIITVWTAHPTPVSVNLTVSLPKEKIVEGSNMTILCTVVGTPQPEVNIFVNNMLVAVNHHKHVNYTVVNIPRNVSSVTCTADNEHDSITSSKKIKVLSKPTFLNHDALFQTIEGLPISIHYIISGHPVPIITWLKDFGSYVQEMRNSKFITISNYTTREAIEYKASLSLQAVKPSDAGDYICKAENQFGSVNQSFQLKVEKRELNPNTLACCRKNGVKRECQSACAFDIDIDYALSKQECLMDLDKLMICAADGSDHRRCCRRHGVSKQCMKWCRGNPVSDKRGCGFSYAKDIINCFEEGKAIIPGQPEIVHIQQLFDTSIYLQWKPPSKNTNNVEWYQVFWRAVGTKKMLKNETRETEFRINNLKQGVTYEVYIKAGNHYGHSQLTVPKVITISIKEINDESTSAVGIVIGVVICILFLVLIGILVIYFKFRYKPNVQKGVSFENPTYMKEISLQNVDERSGTDNAENLQKGNEDLSSRKAVANIYEEPKVF